MIQAPLRGRFFCILGIWVVIPVGLNPSVRRCAVVLASGFGVLVAPIQVEADQVRPIARKDLAPVRTRVYWPRPATCRGVAVVSPGAGGSGQGYAYLGRGLAAGGYLTVVVDHNERIPHVMRLHRSGDGLQGALERLLSDPQAQASRLKDLAAAKQWAEQHCGGSTSVLIGHSMGAAAAMIEAGAKNRLGIRGSNGFTAYVAISPQGSGSIFPAGAWSQLDRPVLSLTGTRDGGLRGASWTTRLEPFHAMPPGCKWLAVIDGATHSHFAARGESSRVEEMTLETIAAFLKSLERGDCRPRRSNPAIRLQVK